MANNPGINKLARVLAGRIKGQTETPLTIDLAEIGEGYSLITDTFPIPIPKHDYEVNQEILEKIKKGDRVLVAWVHDTAIIICVIESGTELGG